MGNTYSDRHHRPTRIVTRYHLRLGQDESKYDVKLAISVQITLISLNTLL